MAHFEIQDLTFTYPTAGGRPSLTDVSLSIAPGEYVVLCGRSGSGKTTLLRHLKTVLTPQGKRSGRVLFCGKPLGEVTPEEQASRIGYVMQNPDEQIVTDKVWHELAWKVWAVTRKPCGPEWRKWPAILAFRTGSIGMWTASPVGRSSS